MNTDVIKINTDNKKKYKYQNLTSIVLNAAFEVHNALGCGFLEKVYEKALVQELKEKNVKVETQRAYKINYKGQNVGTYIADIVVENKVIVELKVTNFLSAVHKAQTLNYLRASGNEVALILNFSNPKLEYKRVVV